MSEAPRAGLDAGASNGPVVHRAYRYRLYPNEGQRIALARTFGSARYVWNWALARKSEAYRERGERIGFPALSRSLTTLRKAEGTEWLSDVLRKPLEQSLRDLDAAYGSFFAGRTAFPRFKRKGSAQSVRYSGDSFRAGLAGLSLQKTPGTIRVRWSRALPSSPVSCTVSVDAAGRYHASFLCVSTVRPLASVERVVGVDLGIAHFAVLSTGEKVANPRHLDASASKLRQAHKAFSRKQKGSANREKARRQLARLYARVTDQRRDFLQKLSTRLIRENQAVAVETLNVKGMTKNRSLARHVGQAGWSEFVRMLDYKAAWYGREVHWVGRFETTTGLCSTCGHRPGKLPLSVRVWTCAGCGAEHDRDVNAALNILAARNAATACGDGGSPGRASVKAAVCEAGTRL